MKNLINELREDKRFVFILLGIFLAAILAAVLMVILSTNAKSTKYENNLNYGYSSMDAGAYYAAIEAFETAYSVDPTYEAAVGLAKAWHAYGNTEKAIQVVTSRQELYETTDELDALLEEYKEAIGYYKTAVIGGKTIDRSDTAIILKDVTLTEEDKANLAKFPELVTLSLINCGLTDIEFLSDCTKLMSVTLSGNPISDFTPLHGNTELRTLYIDATAITDYDQLHTLTSLTTLNLSNNWITVDQRDALEAALPVCTVYTTYSYLIDKLTLGGLTFYTDITELNLSGMGLSDVSILPRCSALERLDLSDNKLSWLTNLGDVSSLKWLSLSGNGLSNISVIDTLTKLTYLDLTDNKVTDITPLAAMTDMTELYLSGNPLYHGHAVLSGMPYLEKLDLSDSLLQDKHLKQINMTSMKELDLRNNKNLTEAAVLAFVNENSSCTILHDFAIVDVTLGSKSFKSSDTTVDASYSSITDLSPLTGFKTLTSLNLAGNGISDFTLLKSMTGLTELNLSATGMSDTAALAGLSALQKLDLSGNSLKDIYPLSSCRNLSELTLSNNAGITDLSPLSYCSKLTTLRVDGTSVSDLSPLSRLTNLTTLVLDNCPVADFTKLHSLSGLKSLYIIDCGITADQLSALQQALPGCTIYAGEISAAPEASTEAEPPLE